jgi:hypothetical protein
VARAARRGWAGGRAGLACGAGTVLRVLFWVVCDESSACTGAVGAGYPTGPPLTQPAVHPTQPRALISQVADLPRTGPARFSGVRRPGWSAVSGC